jgi:putative toxin-antitoxin system antitoxin component (TIGR02293 family)
VSRQGSSEYEAIRTQVERGEPWRWRPDWDAVSISDEMRERQTVAELKAPPNPRPDERMVLEALGVRDGHRDLISVVREGLPSSAFRRAADRAGLTREELIRALRVGRASIFRRLASKQQLAPDDSQKLVRLARATLLAEHVLEGAAQARAWLREPVPALGGERPVDLLDTDEGARAVEEILLRIEYGFFA